MSASVEIICIGTELLIGKTLNTNAHWLAKRITVLGLKVHRITTSADEVDEISDTLREALQHKPQFIITTGGLGPTFDDKTLEGIAKGLICELQINDDALKMIEKTYSRYVEERLIDKVELTPPRVKMAKLPEGAKPLPNPIGTAPGVLIEHEGTIIVALPGVPSEMGAIFEESVISILERAAGDATFFETSIYVSGVMESDIAPLIDQVMHNNPYVYIKSHPGLEGEKKPRLELHLTTTAKDLKLAKNRVGKAFIEITELVQQKGGKTRSSREVKEA
jgi:molybdenum cofactor synthesis domain-containing protein